jgi:CTP synthase
MHKAKNPRYIFVTGGVLSGLGKGIVSASIGKLLVEEYKVLPIKCDGYLNTDPGTMNPIEHGEVFVLDDGGEVDMDFGHYERFLNINCKFDWNPTSGKIFSHIISKERKGEFLGKTVQLIPHVTDEIKNQWQTLAKKENADFVLIELGGTIGDMEMDLFAEAARQLKLDLGEKNCLYVHLTYVPKLNVVGEQKTKPTQQSFNILQSKGLRPEIIVGRANDQLTEKTKRKIALFGNLSEDKIISNPDLKTVYELPLVFEKEGLVKLIENKFNIKTKINDKWKELVNNIKNPKQEINIAICGKYTELKDSYASIMEALIHSGAHLNCKVNLVWLETTDIENDKVKLSDSFKNIDGVIVPGGFGSRGVEGKIKTIKYIRENNIPFLGICYGLQLAVTEFARNVCNLNGAHSTEVNENSIHPVVDILPEQKEIENKGGTMRLGAYEAKITKGSIIESLYKSETASERHRHRYEVNPEYHQILEDKGLLLSGKSFDGKLVEFIELPDHKYFVATQGHPELKSRLERPAPLFLGLVKAAIGKRGN